MMPMPQAPVAHPGKGVSLLVAPRFGSSCAGLVQDAGVKGNQDGACSLHLGCGVVDHICNLQATSLVEVDLLCKGRPTSLLVSNHSCMQMLQEIQLCRGGRPSVGHLRTGHSPAGTKQQGSQGRQGTHASVNARSDPACRQNVHPAQHMWFCMQSWSTRHEI